MYRMLIIGKKIGLKDWFICYNCATGGGGGKLYWILQQKPPQLIYSSRVLWFNRPMRDELEFWLKNNFILPPSPSLHPPSTLDLTALFTIYLFSYRPDFGYQICCEPLCPPPPMSEYDWIWPLFSRNQLLRINESLSPTRPLPPALPHVRVYIRIAIYFFLYCPCFNNLICCSTDRFYTDLFQKSSILRV